MLSVFLLLPAYSFYIFLLYTSGAPDIFPRYSLKQYTENAYGAGFGTRNKTG